MSVISVSPQPSPGPTAPAAIFEPAPLADPGSLELGVTTLAHLATSLRVRREPALPEGSIRLEPLTPAPDTTFHALARRRSVRNFGARALGAGELGSILRFSAAVPAELSRAVRLYVVGGKVTGLAPGVYEYHAASQQLSPRRSGELMAAAGRAALDQEAVGGAHAVLVTTLDRRLLEGEGPRGYRHAFLEAGLIGARVYLEAVARELGACSVGAFYDGEAAELLGVDPQKEWVIHFQALGTLP